MASIGKRKTRNGTTRYRVRWRMGGGRTGDWASETFDQKAKAVTFKLAVEACGHYWPDKWIKGPAGHQRCPTPSPSQNPTLRSPSPTTPNASRNGLAVERKYADEIEALYAQT